MTAENKDFSVDVLQTLGTDYDSNSCIIGWNRSLLDTDFVKQSYKLYNLIDNSGSMDELISDSSCEPPKLIRKMDVVKETLVESLLAMRGLSVKTGIKIYVCLLTFNDRVVEVMPLTIVDDSTFQTFVDKINGIGCGGSTLLGEAIDATMTLMNTGSLPSAPSHVSLHRGHGYNYGIQTEQLYDPGSSSSKIGGLVKSVKSFFSGSSKEGEAKSAEKTEVKTTSTIPGISKLVMLTDGHANGQMKSPDIAKKFADKLSVCIGIGNASNYDADLLKALSPLNTYGGFSADTIRQNFVGALFSMYTLIAKDLVISFPTGIDFMTPSELISGSLSQTISLPDFHPMRKIVLTFKSPKGVKVELPCEIKYFDVLTQTTKIFNIVAVAQPDKSEFNTHMIEYCLITGKFTKITNAINMKFGNREQDMKNTKEQQDEIEKLFNHMKAFKPCSPHNPIYEIWQALYFDIERINKLKHGNVADYIGSMSESRQQQSSGKHSKIMKNSSDYMSKISSVSS